MNSEEQFEAEGQVDSRTIMRLVDDELSPDERRSVLRRLEAVGGWRACALAFLEDQSLRRELSPRDESPDVISMLSMRPDDSENSVSPSDVSPTYRGDERLTWKSFLATAATIAFAFAVGWYGSQGSGLGQAVPESIVNQTPAANNNQQSLASNSTSQPQQDLTGTYSAPASSFWEQESVIPIEVRRALAEKGTEVRRQRGLMPYWLPDGRRVTVPYEDVQLVPVNRVSY